MKLHVSVAALAAAAGAFSYGSQVRAQAITVAPVENITEGLVLEQDQNLIVNPGYSITNYDAEVAMRLDLQPMLGVPAQELTSVQRIRVRA